MTLAFAGSAGNNHSLAERTGKGEPAMRRIAVLAALLPVIACAPAPPYARLPADAVIGAGDPTRAAIIGSASAFGTPASLAGRPDAAARAAAQVEYLATEI